jgi:integrase
VDREILADYVEWRCRSCGNSAIAIDLHFLRLALRLICPSADWAWLLTVTKRFAAQVTPRLQKFHLVTSERLYALGIKLMEHAVESANASGSISSANAFEYRDGLVIALLALIPLRRRTLAALRIGKHLVRTGDLWALDIPAEDTKSRRPVEYPISQDLSARVDLYLTQFRSRVRGAGAHDGLWASSEGRPMGDGTLYDTVRQRTREAFGFPVNLHRFRHAAATFWSIRDPVNVRGAKDLLGQQSFGPTEKHYIMARSRIAGCALARAIAGTRNGATAS